MGSEHMTSPVAAKPKAVGNRARSMGDRASAIRARSTGPKLTKGALVTMPSGGGVIPATVMARYDPEDSSDG